MSRFAQQEPVPGPVVTAPRGPPDTHGPTMCQVDLRREVRDYEIAAIHAALEAARHNQRKAAELLKLTYHQFRGYLKKYEILKQD